MRRIPITAITLALLCSTAPAWAQTQVPTQAQSDLRQARDQAARDRQGLEAARKSGDPVKIRAAEDKLRASQRKARGDRRQAESERDRLEREQYRAREHREDTRRGSAERRREEEQRASSERNRDGKSKSSWAHAEKKGQGKNKER